MRPAGRPSPTLRLRGPRSLLGRLWLWLWLWTSTTPTPAFPARLGVLPRRSPHQTPRKWPHFAAAAMLLLASFTSGDRPETGQGASRLPPGAYRAQRPRGWAPQAWSAIARTSPLRGASGSAPHADGRKLSRW